MTDRMVASLLDAKGPDSWVGLSLLAGLVSCSFPLSSASDLTASSISERSVSEV